MRNLTSFAALAFTFATVAAGCASTSSTDTDDDATDQADGSKTDADYPQGIYNATSSTVVDGNLKNVTLSSDKTYARQVEGLVCPVSTPSSQCGIETGTYSFSHSGATKYIRFYDASGALADRFAYTTDNDKLSLRQTGETAWAALDNVVDTVHLKAGAVCADVEGNLLGECPVDEPCQADDITANATQMCLPEI